MSAGHPSRRIRVPWTSRRLRTAERRRRRLRAAAALGAVVALLLLAGGVVLVRDVVVVRDALRASEAELRRLPAAFGDRDATLLMRSVATASSELSPAELRTTTWRWRRLAGLPRLGAPLAMVADITVAVRAGLDVAEILATDEVLAGITPRIESGQIDLEPVVRLADALSDAPIDELAMALGSLEAAETSLAPTVVLDARTEVLGLLRPALVSLERARDLTAGLPVFLGSDGPRQHLVVLQTSSELRGTGGLIGVLAVLRADAGRLQVGATRTYDPIAADGRMASSELEDLASDAAPDDLVLKRLPAGARPVLEADYAARYGHVDPGGSLSNVNVDPDVPTSGEVLLDLYELRTGLRLDGVVFLDPIGLAALLAATDTVLTLPPESIAGTDAPRALAPDQLATFILSGVYEHFGAERSNERDALSAVLAAQALDAVFTRPWDATRMSEAVLTASAGRHLQVHSRDRVVADALRTSPVGGRLADEVASMSTDVFAVTANNAVGGKQDVHVGHATQILITLGDPAAAGPVRQVPAPDGRSMRVRELERRVSLRTTVTNPLVPGSQDLYVTGNCLVGTEAPGCFLGREADHRVWLTFWLGAADVPWSVRDANGHPQVRVGYFHGVTTIDRHLEVGSRAAGWVEVIADGAIDVELAADGNLIYRMRWWRQAKAIPDLLDISIEPPAGWEAVDVSLETGPSIGGDMDGTGGLLGPDRGRAPITVLSDPDRVHVSGITGRDTTLTVTLRRASR
jgi:hypothetical protein